MSAYTLSFPSLHVGTYPRVVWHAHAAMLPRASSLTRVFPRPLSRVFRRYLRLSNNPALTCVALAQARIAALRNNTWMNNPTDAADVMYSSLIDHQSINSKVAKGEQRMVTVMHKCLPRSPTELDSRRPNEKLKFKVFEVVAPVSTTPEIGPGRYSHARPTDIGSDKRQFQAWKNPLRNNTWMVCPTDAPEGEAYLQSSPFNIASRNKCGGYLKDCWPQPEDEQGRPVTGLFVPRTPLSVGKKGNPPATA